MKRIFHFDVNRTIIGTDSTDDISLLSTVKQCICCSIDVDGNFLTHKSGKDNYYQHLKDNNKNYKELCESVLDTFPQYQPLVPQLIDVFSQGLFPSFRQVLTMYPEDKIVLRTFGHDGPEVIKDLQPMKFVSFQAVWTGNEVSFRSSDGNLYEMEEVLTMDSHILIVDNYKHWNKNGRSKEVGKIIKSLPGVIQIGFDDNDCMSTVGDNVYFFQVNTILAAINSSLFTDIIRTVTGD